MFLQGPDVSSIFAAQTIKQPKRMTVKQCNFKVGEVYLFHTDDPRCPDAESLWGLYDRHDGGSVRLESCSTDQKHFSKGRHLPEQYGSAASRPAVNYVITWSTAFARK